MDGRNDDGASRTDDSTSDDGSGDADDDGSDDGDENGDDTGEDDGDEAQDRSLLSERMDVVVEDLTWAEQEYDDALQAYSIALEEALEIAEPLSDEDDPDETTVDEMEQRAEAVEETVTTEFSSYLHAHPEVNPTGRIQRLRSEMEVGDNREIDDATNRLYSHLLELSHDDFVEEYLSADPLVNRLVTITDPDDPEGSGLLKSTSHRENPDSDPRPMFELTYSGAASGSRLAYSRAAERDAESPAIPESTRDTIDVGMSSGPVALEDVFAPVSIEQDRRQALYLVVNDFLSPDAPELDDVLGYQLSALPSVPVYLQQFEDEAAREAALERLTDTSVNAPTGVVDPEINDTEWTGITYEAGDEVLYAALYDDADVIVIAGAHRTRIRDRDETWLELLETTFLADVDQEDEDG